LPLPVGAVTRTLSPSAIAGQAAACGAVGVPNRSVNHSATGRENSA